MRGRRQKPITKEQCLKAMDATKSVKAAARYLGHSYDHVKQYFKLYRDEATGKTLFELHKNQQGKGIRKFIDKGRRGDVTLLDLIEGRVDINSHNPQRIKQRLMEEGFLGEFCARCHFNEKRLLDYKAPLLIHFRNGNRRDYKLENLEMLCYNCYFLYVANVFHEKDMEKLEGYTPTYKEEKGTHFELDEYHLQRLRELGLDSDEDDGLDIISRL